MGLLRFIGNIFWFLLTGIETAILYFALGLVWCVTIIGIPFGIQAFKLAGLSIWPMGREVNKEKGHPIANVLWFILGGFALFVYYVVFGIAWCITIVGIPFGKQCFKLAHLSFTPFGRNIQKA